MNTVALRSKISAFANEISPRSISPSVVAELLRDIVNVLDSVCCGTLDDDSSDSLAEEVENRIAADEAIHLELNALSTSVRTNKMNISTVSSLTPVSFAGFVHDPNVISDVICSDPGVVMCANFSQTEGDITLPSTFVFHSLVDDLYYSHWNSESAVSEILYKTSSGIVANKLYLNTIAQYNTLTGALVTPAFTLFTPNSYGTLVRIDEDLVRLSKGMVAVDDVVTDIPSVPGLYFRIVDGSISQLIRVNSKSVGSAVTPAPGRLYICNNSLYVYNGTIFNLLGI